MSNNLEIIELKSHVYGINFPLLEKRNENLISFDETTTERKKRRMERSKSFETWARPRRNITDRDCRCNDKPCCFEKIKNGEEAWIVQRTSSTDTSWKRAAMAVGLTALYREALAVAGDDDRYDDDDDDG